MAFEMLSCGKPIPGPGVQVRSMLVPGCAWRCPQISGAARRGGSSRFASVGNCAFFRKASAPFPAWEGHRFGARNAPHIFFCLGKRQGELPEGQERGPWGQTCRARYKRKPPFIGLLVRPVKTGLGSSSCAKRRALPVRSRRICFIGCKLEDAKRTRGPSCAAAARPGICSKFFPRRCIYALLLPTERQRRCCGKQSYLHQQVI